MTNHFIAYFESASDAALAADHLHQMGISEVRFSALMAEGFYSKHFGVEDATKAPEGAATGGLIGGVLGALAGTFITASSVAIPGIGLIVAGPIVAALAGAGAGATAGGALGGLIGLGVPEHQAKSYEEAIKNQGGMLLGVQLETGDDEDKIKETLIKFGGRNIYEA